MELCRNTSDLENLVTAAVSLLLVAPCVDRRRGKCGLQWTTIANC